MTGAERAACRQAQTISDELKRAYFDWSSFIKTTPTARKKIAKCARPKRRIEIRQNICGSVNNEPLFVIAQGKLKSKGSIDGRYVST
ncbi:hypothetical protein PI126_g6633 [Phytophthora idaei]|nr:hypothetical protein PI126_g6633 [Phytophthora idaei]